MSKEEIDHPIVALATPRSKSALAIIRVTGNNCIPLFSPFLPNAPRPIVDWKANTTQRAKIIDPKNSEFLDEAIISIYKAPHSYTGQDSIELSLHGSLVGIDKILNALISHGFTLAEPGEFTKRAFMSGKLDLTQAEAIHSLIESHSAESHSQALVQLTGSLTRYINKLKTKILHLVAKLHVCLDYPDDEIQESVEINVGDLQAIIDSLTQSIQGYDLVRLHREGYICIIAGLTNAGKSSLYNSLVKEDRSIVSSTHGTTRDFIESNLSLGGIHIRLYDTAGLRFTDEDVEKKGISRSYDLIKSANLILYIVDSSKGLQEEDRDQLSWMISHVNQVDHKIIIVWNKIDLAKDFSPPQYIEIISEEIPSRFDTHISISSKDYTNIELLQDLIFSHLDRERIPMHEDVALINSLRQKQKLEECKNFLLHVVDGLESKIPLDMLSLDMDSALSCLGAITGEVYTEDILDTMFSEFCVGK